MTVTATHAKVSEEKFNFAHQIFAKEPISATFAEFDFPILRQNCENEFLRKFVPRKFLPAENSANKVILKQKKVKGDMKMVNVSQFK